MSVRLARHYQHTHTKIDEGERKIRDLRTNKINENTLRNKLKTNFVYGIPLPP